MSMNSEIHFSQIPNVEKQRSRFDRSFEHKTTLNTGDLFPVSWDEVLPGDTITMDFSHVTRMTTPIAPVMDEAAMDVYAFFVPNRLIWNHWKEFWGENNSTHWEQPTEYHIPKIEFPSGGWNEGSLANYLGLPIGIDNKEVNHLPFRAYAKIVNDWFRDENLKDPCYITMDETTVSGINKGVNYDYVTDIEKGAACYKVAKWHDYFTSALPEPQKGPDVKIPLGISAPIIGTDNVGSLTADTNLIGKDLYFAMFNVTGGGSTVTGQVNGIDTDGSRISPTTSTSIGMAADLSDATSATINQLRQAFAVQRFYEAQARGGSRYIEFIKNIFGVTSPDARQQRSEYLGGKRFQINMDQVLQTSSTDVTSPQGNTAAFSCTINSDNLFTYSATEHGILFVLCCIRTNHSYQQGINKAWLRDKWTDYYVPQFANLGEMPIYNAELYAQGDNVLDSDGNIVDDQVFGYQEAWADYRYKPNMVTGKMRSNATGPLDFWHYADYYTSLPQLSGEWIDETEANVQRTLAVQNEPQFQADFYLKSIWTRVMPLYSVPGLLDHH